jgi:hypothetical protein
MGSRHNKNQKAERGSKREAIKRGWRYVTKGEEAAKAKRAEKGS